MVDIDVFSVKNMISNNKISPEKVANIIVSTFNIGITSDQNMKGGKRAIFVADKNNEIRDFKQFWEDITALLNMMLMVHNYKPLNKIDNEKIFNSLIIRCKFISKKEFNSKYHGRKRYLMPV